LEGEGEGLASGGERERRGERRGKERGKEGKGEEEERFEELLKLSFFCFLHSTLRSIASRNK
jgi:hypothetical protein